MTDEPVPPTPPIRDSSRTIPATCRTHVGAIGFANLGVRRVDGKLVLDPHITGACLFELDETQAMVLRDLVTEWFG